MFQVLIPGDWEVGAFQRGLLEMAGYKELAEEEQQQQQNDVQKYYTEICLWVS